MVRSDKIVAIAVIGVSLFLFMQTGAFIEEGGGEQISAAFFPRCILISLIGCCAWLVFKSTMNAVSFPAAAGVALGAAQIVAYVLLINPLGYFVVTPLFLFLLPASLGYRRWGWLAALAAGGTAFAYVVFLKILGVPLPMGILENLVGGAL